MPRAPSPSAASTATGGADASAENDDTDDELLRPPENFAMVSPKLYRSSFPRTRNFPFLRSLGLKSVMVLVQEPYPEENLEFLKREGILFFQFGMPANKEPFVSIPEDKIVAALSTILDVRNHPMLIHCNKGKHRTGCVVGCLRRLQLWSLVSVFDEYRRYSHPKSRAMDLQCIEAFGGLPKTVDRAHLPRWATLDPPPLPPTAPLPVGAASALSTDDETSSVGEP
ncbi:tyrosine phosphatase family-domain-containing protein [Rhodotorula diobovata]|uniref:diphosphoinositol-polyphosphate diphosphatase n=1 Tax=Rhodotorula diobovata TaxID=5288 RepID=A0A5C5G6I7_9BASI|nr:tyrosine phosphatase family-domain-containing protein [Rhodotorula diobovata]